jgi:hypothetical protein
MGVYLTALCVAINWKIIHVDKRTSFVCSDFFTTAAIPALPSIPKNQAHPKIVSSSFSYPEQ